MAMALRMGGLVLGMAVAGQVGWAAPEVDEQAAKGAASPGGRAASN